MDEAQKKAEVVAALVATDPQLTAAQRDALAEKLIKREVDRYGEGDGMWVWFPDAGQRAEEIGYRISNMRREDPSQFRPAPSAEATFAALLAKAVEDAKGLDITHPEHPSTPGNKRTLLRLVEKMSPDERIAAVDGLTLAPETSPAPETREQVEQVAPEFTGPGDPRFRAWVARTYGTPEHLQLSRKNAEIYRALTATNPQRGLDRRTLAVAETQVKTRELSPAERREQARAQQRLARAAR